MSTNEILISVQAHDYQGYLMTITGKEQSDEEIL